MIDKVLVAIYILSTPKLDKNVPETTKYTFYDILASNQDIFSQDEFLHIRSEPLEKNSIWDKGGFGFLRPSRNYILMLPLSKLVAFFGMRVNKMAAVTYNAKILTFLLLIIRHWK